MLQTIKTHGLGLSTLSGVGLLMLETCVICNRANTVLESTDDELLCNSLFEALMQSNPYLWGIDFI